MVVSDEEKLEQRFLELRPVEPNEREIAPTKNLKSRVKGDFHARFCVKGGVKYPGLTRLYSIRK